VGELEREKEQELAAWEQSRSELVLETTRLQAKLAGSADSEQCETAISAALKERVAVLEAVVGTCRSEFASVMSATQELEALVTALDKKNRFFQKQTYALETVVEEARRVCGQAAAELATQIVNTKQYEQTVHPSSWVICYPMCPVLIPFSLQSLCPRTLHTFFQLGMLGNAL
jgi:hypothetical protein